MSIAGIPTEIIALITSHADRAVLKVLRLTNHEFLIPATEYLFKEIHISPNSLSFGRASEVSLHRHLKKYVKSLVYHFGLLGDIYPGFELFRHEYFSIRRPGESRDPSEITAEVLWCYNCWLEEIDAQMNFACRDEYNELQVLCDRLPHLESISTLMDDPESLSDPQDYIGKRTGMVALEADGDIRFAKLFAAVVGRPLSKISARSIGWADIEAIQEMPLESGYDCLSELRYLELGIYNALNEAEDTFKDEVLVLAHHLENVLGRTNSLAILKLDFDELPLESHADMMLPVSKAIFSHFWPTLQELKLEAICAYEDELFDFLSAHRWSLQKLCLGDIELVRLSEASKVPSVLHLFQRIRENLRLRSCRITGNFTNRIDQAWYVDTEYERPGCLRDRLEEYICNLDFAASNDGVGATNELTVISQHSTRLQFWIGRANQDFDQFVDESWYWCPELLDDYDPVDPD